VTHPTVAAVRHELEAAGDVENFSTRTDTKGRAQPAHKARPHATREDLRATTREMVTEVQSLAAVVDRGSRDGAAPDLTVVTALDDAEAVRPTSKAFGSLNALLRVDPAKGLVVIQQALRDAPLSQIPKEKRIAKARSFLDALGVEVADLLLPTMH
jgi:hypothetical protein